MEDESREAVCEPMTTAGGRVVVPGGDVVVPEPMAFELLLVPAGGETTVPEEVGGMPISVPEEVG